MTERHEPPHWCVEVSAQGENFVTIESRMLAGKPDLTESDLDVIREAAHSLLAFAGRPLGDADRRETPPQWVQGVDWGSGESFTVEVPTPASPQPDTPAETPLSPDERLQVEYDRVLNRVGRAQAEGMSIDEYDIRELKAEVTRLTAESAYWRECYERPFERFEAWPCDAPVNGKQKYRIAGFRRDGTQVNLRPMFLLDSVIDNLTQRAESAESRLSSLTTQIEAQLTDWRTLAATLLDGRESALPQTSRDLLVEADTLQRCARDLAALTKGPA